MTTTANPVFIKGKDIPDADANRPTVLEMCLAAEKTSGQGTIIGAQEIRGLWRLYPAKKEDRTELLIRGVRMRGATIQAANTNPFMLRNDTGEEKPVTKVWIDNLPISVADSEIEHSLSKLGCELRSAVKTERARDADNKMTRFLTGRRFVFITMPTTPLERTLKISIFTARIFHREQKAATRLFCSKCLEAGHHSSTCDRDVVCRACKQSGHKRGDPACEFSIPEKERQSGRLPIGGRPSLDNTEQSRTEREERAEPTGDRRKDERDEGRRGRTNARQTTLRPTLALDFPRRQRSETPKRRRSKDGPSPGKAAVKGKQPRCDDSPQDSQAQSVQDDDTGLWG